jgi:hypothetical protein
MAHSGGVNDERDTATACLVAAAPDLFAACDAAKVLIGAQNDDLSEAARQSNINEAWHILDAAIAKAVQP